jgi:hypothetical protein
MGTGATTAHVNRRVAQMSGMKECKLFLIRHEYRGGPGDPPTEVSEQVGDTYPSWDALQDGLQTYYEAHGGAHAVSSRCKVIEVHYLAA